MLFLFIAGVLLCVVEVSIQPRNKQLDISVSHDSCKGL